MKIDWKKAIGLTAAVAMLVPLAACGGSSDGGDKNASGSTEAVTLSVWAPQEDQAKDTNWLGKVEENFAKAHPEYNITWKNDVVSEGDASKQVSTDPSAAADVYMFASDQLGVLMDAKAIGQLGTDAEKQVKEQNGDLEVNSVTGTDGKLYGVPYTDNTWFMYYNKSKITEDEAKDFDTILSKAKVTFPLQNSWYINGFYDGLSLFGEKGNDADAGMVFPKDGADITSYLVDVVANPNFSNDDGASGLAAIKDGSADVLFSGTWSAKDVKEALGDNYAATSLPTFTVNGQKKQMKSFAATKAAAYNPNAKNPKAAAQFAAYLGSTEAQKLHYEMRAIPPTDKSLSDLTTDDIDKSRIFVCVIDWTGRHAVKSGAAFDVNTFWDPEKQSSVSEGPILGYGSVTLEQSSNGWETLTLPINWYDQTAFPTAGNYSLVISCATSYKGDYVAGSTNNVLYVEDFEWVY